MLWAITGKTAAEIIESRSNPDKLNMGLTAWRGSIVRKHDVGIAKNYLKADEIKDLNEDVTYRRDKDGAWPARVYLPEGQGPFPALLDVHGGAWTRGGCADDELIDRSLAASGMVVIAMECRKSPKYPYPSQPMDVNYATRWCWIPD